MALRLALNHLTVTVRAGVQGSQQLLSLGSQKPQNKSENSGTAQGQGQVLKGPEEPAVHVCIQRTIQSLIFKSHRKRANLL